MARPSRMIRSEFPKLAGYIKFTLPQIRQDKPNVWDRFLHWSQLPEKIALRAIAFDEKRPPVVKLTAKDGLNGYFSSKSPRVIWLARKVAEAYQNGETGAVLLVESTIMHELVHWGNYITKYGLDSRETHAVTKADGKKAGGYIKNADGDSVEVGKQFEIQAYGADINYQNMSKRHTGACGTCKKQEH